MKALFTVCIFSLAGLGGCSGDKAEEGGCDSILPHFSIGGVYPSTGGSLVGELWIKSAQMAVAAINKAGGVNNRCVELQGRDSAGDKIRGLEKARALAADPNIRALVTGSSTTTACYFLSEVLNMPLDPQCPYDQTLTDPEKLPVVCMACSAPDFDLVPFPSVEGAAPLWRTAQSSLFQGAQYAAAVLETGNESAGIYYIDILFGRGLAVGAGYNGPEDRSSWGGFAKAYVDSSGTIEPGWIAAHPPNTSLDVAGDLMGIFGGATDPDVLVVGSLPQFTTAIVNQWYSLGPPSDLFLTHAAFSTEIFSSSNIDSAAASRIKGLTYAQAAGYKGNLFATDYQEVVGEAMVPFTDGSYDSIVVIVLAAIASGADDPGRLDIQRGLQLINNPSGTVIGYGDLAQAIEVLAAGGAINYQGVSGDLDFDLAKNNRVVSSYWKYSLVESGGKFQFDTSLLQTP